MAFIGNGSGTLADPYQVSNVSELLDIANNLDKHFIQISDIDMTAQSFTPLGDNNIPFTGSYNGQIYEISNLTFNGSVMNVGLFGVTENATLKHIQLTNVNIDNSYQYGAPDYEFPETGGLVGKSFRSLITKCSVTGTITAYGNTGGMLGKSENDSIIDSYTNVDVTGKTSSSEVGGFISHGEYIDMKRCYAAGSVSASGGSYIGGFAFKLGGLMESIYYDSDVAGTAWIGPGEPKSTSDMYNQITYDGFDFFAVWKFNSGSYPTLKCKNVNTSGTFAGGSGTSIDPYLIATPQQLRNINTALDDNFILVKDIDMTGESFVPIGTRNFLQTTPFTGTIDGQHYTIKNITVEAGDHTHAGFFGAINGGFVFNLIIENIIIDDSCNADYAGGFAGRTEYARISRCSVTGSVRASYYAGGFIGSFAAGDVGELNYIKDCFSGCAATCTNTGDTGIDIGAPSPRAAGFIAWKFDQDINLLPVYTNISNSYCYGIVSSANGNEFGFMADTDTSVTNCYYDIESTTVNTSAVAEGKNTNQMYSKYTYNDWDFYNIWKMESNDYPQLVKSEAVINPIDEVISFAGGSGTELDPYLIATIDHFRAIAAYPDAYYKQINDIDMSNMHLYPIGEEARFTGTYDGGGYEISNLTYVGNNFEYPSLFGYVDTARIQDVYLTDVNIKSYRNIFTSQCGALCAKTSNSTIERCSSYGNIIGMDNVGGLIGMTVGTTLNDNASGITIDGNDKVGGLVGTASGISTFNTSFSFGEVTSNTINYGGVLGYGSATSVAVFWDTEASGVSTSKTGVGKTTAEMQNPATFTDYDFGLVWEIDDGYPTLQRLSAEDLFTAGSGTLVDPYEVSTPEQLNAVGALLDKYFIQVNDIDMSGQFFIPIGRTLTPFTGSYNGGRFTISNLSFTADWLDYVGLFGFATGADIENVNLNNINMTNNNSLGYAGALIGYSINNEINVCSVESGTIEAYAFTGGLIGFSSNDIISNSYTKADVNGLDIGTSVGGFVANASSSMRDCYSTGNISVPTGNTSIGGFTAANDDEIFACFWDVETTGVTDPNNTTGYETPYGVGLTTLEMQDQDNYLWWNFTDIWSISTGQYPTLQTGALDHINDTMIYDPWTNDGNPTGGTVCDPGGGAGEDPWTGSKITGIGGTGSGTEADPYLISTVQQFIDIKDHPDWHYVQINDIDLSTAESLGFLPLGTNASFYNYFRGSYDGQGYLLSNLTFTNEVGESYNTGIFGSLREATLKNIRIDNCTINNNATNKETGIICSRSSGSNISYITITNSQVTSAGKAIGAICGIATSDVSESSISNCMVDANITGAGDIFYDAAAGICGIIYANTELTNCIFYGIVDNTVSTIEKYAIAVTPNTGSNTIVTGCYYDSDVSFISEPTGDSSYATRAGIGKTTTEMGLVSTFPEFDFEAVWQMGTNGYPELKYDWTDAPGGSVTTPGAEGMLYTDINDVFAGTISLGGCYQVGDTIHVKAETWYGYQFVNWTDDTNLIVSDVEEFDYILDHVPCTLTANFIDSEDSTYTLTLVTDDFAEGSFIGDGTFYEGQLARIIATPEDGYRFLSWIGDTSYVNDTGEADALVTMPALDIQLEAAFIIDSNILYELIIGINPIGGGIVTGNGTYSYTTSINIEAIPTTGYEFVNWTGADAYLITDPNSATTSFLMPNREANITANFEEIIEVPVIEPPVEGGNVVYVDDGSGTGFIPGYDDYNAQEAIPDEGYEFTQWSDGNTDNPRNFSTFPAEPVTAEFTEIIILPSYTLHYGYGSTGHVSGATAQTVLEGQDGTPVEAIPDYGYEFSQWSDGRTDNPRTDTNVQSNIMVQAEFVPTSFTLEYTVNSPNAELYGETTQSVPYGGTGTAVEVIPADGYKFSQWSDGRTDNPRIDSSISGNINVEADIDIAESVEEESNNVLRNFRDEVLIYVLESFASFHGLDPETVTEEFILDDANGVPTQVQNDFIWTMDYYKDGFGDLTITSQTSARLSRDPLDSTQLWYTGRTNYHDNVESPIYPNTVYSSKEALDKFYDEAGSVNIGSYGNEIERLVKLYILNFISATDLYKFKMDPDLSKDLVDNYNVPLQNLASYAANLIIESASINDVYVGFYVNYVQPDGTKFKDFNYELSQLAVEYDELEVLTNLTNNTTAENLNCGMLQQYSIASGIMPPQRDLIAEPSQFPSLRTFIRNNVKPYIDANGLNVPLPPGT